MAQFLADENVPGESVQEARRTGIDLAWIQEIAPAVDDETVLAISLSEGRVLVTFDKDFGSLAFHQGKRATAGIILLRPRLRSPRYLARFLVAILEKPIDWHGRFAVARETSIRSVPLP